MSLNIGLNSVDPKHYSGWDGKLNACENDARDMASIAKLQGFKCTSTSLIGADATRENVISVIIKIAKKLKSGDKFFMSFSGHGGQLPDLNNDEPDAQDETWCLFNGQFVDDELRVLWTQFKEGVRIFLTSDSCHSGTMIKSANQRNSTYSNEDARFMQSDFALTTYIKNKTFYDNLLTKLPRVAPSEIKANIILISACQDNQLAYDGTFNGEFTSALKQVWNGGKFNKNYVAFHRQILNLLPAYQSPNYLRIGKASKAFESEIPFTI